MGMDRVCRRGTLSSQEAEFPGLDRIGRYNVCRRLPSCLHSSFRRSYFCILDLVVSNQVLIVDLSSSYSL